MSNKKIIAGDTFTGEVEKRRPQQVRVDGDVYFQQTGDEIYGVFVNTPFIKICVDRMLTEKELKELADRFYEACLNTNSVKGKIKEIKKSQD